MAGSREEPPPPPLFRSFFAAEVRALLRGRDVSTIEAEPPPPASPSLVRPGPHSPQAPAPDLTYVLPRAGPEPAAPGPRTPPGSPWMLLGPGPGPGELERSAGAVPDETSSCLSLCSSSFLTSTPLTPPARFTFARALAPRSLLAAGPQPGDLRGSATFFLDAARRSLLADGPGPRDPRGSTTAVPGAAQGSLRRDDLELRDSCGSTTFFLDAAQGSLLGDNPEPRDPCSSTTAVPGMARCSLLADYLGPREPFGSTAADPGAAQGSSLRDPHGSTTFFLDVAQRSVLRDDPEPRDPRSSTTAVLDTTQCSLPGDDPEPRGPRSSTTAVLDAAQGSVLGDNSELRDPRGSTTAVLGDPVQPGPADGTHSTAGPEHLPAPPASPRGKEPAGSNDIAKGAAPARLRVAACSIPTALQALAPASCSSRRAPAGRGCALAGYLSRVSLSSLRLSLQQPVGTRDVPLGSQTEAQPPAQVPAGTAAKQSSARLLGVGKCSTGLRPPSRLPGLGGSRAGPGGLQAPTGMELPGSSKGARAFGTGLPPRPGSKRQLMKPGPGNPALAAGAPPPLGATSSPQDKAPGINTTYSASHVQAAAKAARSRLPPRRAVAGPVPATAVAPRSRLRPPAKASASPRSLPPCKRVRLGEGAQGRGAQQEPALADGSPGPGAAEASSSTGDAAQGPTCRGPVAVLRSSPHAAPRGMGAAAPMQSPGNLLHRELEQAQNELELARSELQRVQRELEGARTELAEKDAQCQAYRRVIADLQAQLGAAGSVAEGCRLEA